MQTMLNSHVRLFPQLVYLCVLPSLNLNVQFFSNKIVHAIIFKIEQKIPQIAPERCSRRNDYLLKGSNDDPSLNPTHTHKMIQGRGEEERDTANALPFLLWCSSLSCLYPNAIIKEIEHLKHIQSKGKKKLSSTKKKCPEFIQFNSYLFLMKIRNIVPTVQEILKYF